MRLGEGARAAGYRHEHLASIGSTNAEALRLGQDRLWVTADEQTAGRGRRGRAWASPPGNVYSSLLLLNPSEPRATAELCFVTAVALADATAAVAPGAAAAMTLKWPNDLLVAGRKTAGILVEATHGPGGAAVVIGCGVNVAHHPDGLPYPATHLAEHDPTVTVAGVFTAYADAMALRLAEWARGAGFAAIRAAWLARAGGLGAALVARLPDRDLAGTFEGLDEAGALLLREPSGTRHIITVGEVFPAIASEPATHLSGVA